VKARLSRKGASTIARHSRHARAPGTNAGSVPSKRNRPNSERGAWRRSSLTLRTVTGLWKRQRPVPSALDAHRLISSNPDAACPDRVGAADPLENNADSSLSSTMQRVRRY
jgi:hypothetical protein